MVQYQVPRLLNWNNLHTRDGSQTIGSFAWNSKITRQVAASYPKNENETYEILLYGHSCPW